MPLLWQCLAICVVVFRNWMRMKTVVCQKYESNALNQIILLCQWSKDDYHLDWKMFKCQQHMFLNKVHKWFGNVHLYIYIYIYIYAFTRIQDYDMRYSSINIVRMEFSFYMHWKLGRKVKNTMFPRLREATIYEWHTWTISWKKSIFVWAFYLIC